MARLPRNPKFWLGAFLLWFAVLWTLSSFSGQQQFAPPIDHFDKLAHFGYFFGGSGLLCAYLFQGPMWKRAVVFLSSMPIAIVLNGFRIGVITHAHR